MKREHPHPHPENFGVSAKGETSADASGESRTKWGSSKLWIDEGTAGGMDELLAVLGYKVRSSDMEVVAQKLEQLEMELGTAAEDGISHLAADTVHYNPSDLSGWVQNMLSKLHTSNPPQQQSGGDNLDPRFPGSTVFGGDDLGAIPGIAAYPPRDLEVGDAAYMKGNKAKRLRVSAPAASPHSSSSSNSQPLLELSRPVVVVDTQETGVRLVHALLACAEAVQQDNLKLADALVKHVGMLAASQPGPMRKVAIYFAEALARRIYKVFPQEATDPSYSDSLETHFYEACPYLKFAHFTANQAILEAFANASRVHVIDFSLKQGTQWPPLMQALALRPGGPPTFRLTGIGPPQPDETDALQQVGWKLAQLAETIGVHFEFRGFVASNLADIEPDMLDLRTTEDEVVAVNSVFELHRLFARPNGIDKVLASIKAMKPKIVSIVEQEANHNEPLFLDRFTESLHYYSSLFDSLEGASGSLSPPDSRDILMSELYLGQQICNVVACEGPDRVERHETLNQWKGRLEAAGFNPVHLGSNAFRQANILLALFAGGDGYRVEESNGCLLLGWHTRPLIATSAWQVG